MAGIYPVVEWISHGGFERKGGPEHLIFAVWLEAYFAVNKVGPDTDLNRKAFLSAFANALVKIADMKLGKVLH